MKTPVEEFELSALIDGELEPQRAEEVRAAIQQDPALQALFTRLATADARWSQQADAAQFQPILPPLAKTPPVAVPAVLPVWMAGLVAALLMTGQFGTKWLALGLGPGILLHSLLLAAVFGLIVRVVRADEAMGSAAAAQGLTGLRRPPIPP
ncbi:MAG TPA: hypothetical protein VL860_01255 [Planctomycetota bacterium]|nr:hypothetical protein [Planctomycetota bacterium]